MNAHTFIYSQGHTNSDVIMKEFSKNKKSKKKNESNTIVLNRERFKNCLF
jgi:hypothetical protein